MKRPYPAWIRQLNARWFGVLSVSFGCACFAAENLAVMPVSPTSNSLAIWFENHLKQQADAALDRRQAAYEKLKSQADCRAWQAERRAFFLRQIGGLPDRTPLNARVVGTLEGKGYRIEKILLESRPGFHLTANLYLPQTPPPWPAVLVPCGHSHDGKAAGGYQRVSILLARHGMAALCYDPVGQGERYQMLDLNREHTHFDNASHVPVPHPRAHVLCTSEHTAMGLGCILLGSNVAQFRIWDGMRAIDYLQSRPDIQPDKIGCTGNSGGGTLTAYLMALDDRILAAAPGCYLTTFRQLIATRGPQDAEQNLFGQLAFGLEEADYLMMRAPKPTLICAATRDVTFDIGGTWELFRESKRFYSRLGHAERVELVEADAPHGFSILLREAAARWMHRWLLGSDKVIREVENLPDPLTDEQARALSTGDWTAQQLQCTPQGQVLLMNGEQSVFQINAKAAEELKPKRTAAWNRLSPEAQRQFVRDTIGARMPETKPARAVEIVGRLERDSYTIHKLILTAEPGLRLPALAFVPARPNGVATLYLHGVSMTNDAAPGGAIDALVKQGHVVLAAELRGIGETETGHQKRDYGYGRFGRDVQEIFLAYLLGKPFVGMRVEDVFSWTQVLREFAPAGAPPRELHLVAIGEGAIPALHAAALAPDAFRTVQLRHMIRSWEEIVKASDTLDQAVNVVHGALRHYDLPDLVNLAGAGKVTQQEPADVMGSMARGFSP